MSLASADIETDLFGFELDTTSGEHIVFRRGVVESRETDNAPTGVHTEQAVICYVAAEAPEGTAEEIVRALNRLPKAEAILIDVCQAIRGQEEARSWGAKPVDLVKVADAIETWMTS